MIVLAKPKKESTLVEISENVMKIGSESVEVQRTDRESVGPSNVAVILANNVGSFGSASRCLR